MRKFGVLILTHGRADSVITVKTLKKAGYTGDIYIVIDDEDDQESVYRAKYGDKVHVFCKSDYMRKTDSMNPEKPRNVVVYARNAAHDIAKNIGLTHFLVLDDDYKSFEWRYPEDGKLKVEKVRDFDRLCSVFCDFLDVSGALTVAMAQGGDYIGGAAGGIANKKLLRKAMNSFFCRTDRPFRFMGTINEDTNCYTSMGNKGHLFFTVTDVSLVQTQTQAQKGGLTEAYLDVGTFVKSFYTVMLTPSCAKIAEMGSKHRRVHHKILWKKAVPMILSEKYRK